MRAGKGKVRSKAAGTTNVDELLATILELEAEMRIAASELQFELAARLRDEVSDMKRSLRDIQRHA
jgi:excinuclease ABC subunit B